ncbi:MAG: hypothetical protein IJM21_10420 [Clostridia bacterium]|nr:hypothetical protein [Clostridia bacterium]
MKRIRFSPLLILIPAIFIAVFSSCSDVATRHAVMAEEALASMDAEAYIASLALEDADSSNFLIARFAEACYLEDAKDEIASQRQGGSKIGHVFTYDLSVRYPDVSVLTYDKIITGYPEVDWGHVDRTSYSASLRTAFNEALGVFLAGDRVPTHRESVTFTFTRDGGSLTAHPDEEALKSACRAFISDANALFQDYRAAGDYLSIVAAERVNKAIDTESRFPVIFSNTSVRKLEAHEEGGYEVTLDTVDYADLLAAVSEEVYQSYKEANPDGVYAPPDDEVLGGMLKAGMESTGHPLVMTEIVLTSESDDAEYICDLISNVVSEQLSVEVDDLSTRIRENMIRESVSEPRTQILRGASNSKTGIPLKIYTPAKYDSHYIKINDASTGDTYMTIYIREGDSITVYLPVGRYRIRYATGKKWYGFSELFGPDGDYLAFNETISIKKDMKYTLTLYQIADSNLTTKALSQEDF